MVFHTDQWADQNTWEVNIMTTFYEDRTKQCAFSAEMPVTKNWLTVLQATQGQTDHRGADLRWRIVSVNAKSCVSSHRVSISSLREVTQSRNSFLQSSLPWTKNSRSTEWSQNTDKRFLNQSTKQCQSTGQAIINQAIILMVNPDCHPTNAEYPEFRCTSCPQGTTDVTNTDVTNTDVTNTANPSSHQLHWLPISERIKYKTACMCYNSITCSAPLLSLWATTNLQSFKENGLSLIQLREKQLTRTESHQILFFSLSLRSQGGVHIYV